MLKRITQIPYPGSPGKIPTGALQFQSDSPGLFLRIDAAQVLHTGIRNLQKRLASHPDVVVADALQKLKTFADLVERDVLV